MALAVLKEIAFIEEQAEQIEAQAQQKIREIIAAAKKDAAMMIEKAVEQAELDAGRIIQTAEEKAARDIIDIKAKTQAQCHEIKENASTKLEDAVDFIVGRIVKLSDR